MATAKKYNLKAILRVLDDLNKSASANSRSPAQEVSFGETEVKDIPRKLTQKELKEMAKIPHQSENPDEVYSNKTPNLPSENPLRDGRPSKKTNPILPFDDIQGEKKKTAFDKDKERVRFENSPGEVSLSDSSGGPEEERPERDLGRDYPVFKTKQKEKSLKSAARNKADQDQLFLLREKKKKGKLAQDEKALLDIYEEEVIKKRSLDLVDTGEKSQRSPAQDELPEFDPSLPSYADAEEELPEFDPSLPAYKDGEDLPEIDYTDMNRAREVGLERAGTFEARPAIAGLGAAAGGAYGAYEAGGDSNKILNTGINSFFAGRKEAQVEQADLEERFPKNTGTGQLMGNAFSSLYTPAKTFGQAVGVGALSGLGESLGHADGLKDAGKRVASNAATGGTVDVFFRHGGKVIKKAIPEKLVTKFFSNTSSISEPDIKNYAEGTDRINNIIDTHKGNIFEAVETAKKTIVQKLADARGAANTKISTALKSMHKFKTIDMTPVLGKLETVKAQLNPVLDSGSIAEITAMIDDIKSLTQKKGRPNMVSQKHAYEIDLYLMGKSKRSFVKSGQIYATDVKAARAAKDGYLEAKGIVDNFSPEIKEANGLLHELHEIEEQMNPNIIKPGKSDNAYLTGGSGQSPQNQKTLQRMQDATGAPILDDAKDISTANQFADPNFISGDTTGKGMTRAAVGAGAGGLMAYLFGTDPQVGATMGAAATSPMAVKMGINALNQVKKASSAIDRVLNNANVKSAVIQNVAPGSKERNESIKRKLERMK